jgi:hypothetical protein
LDENGDARDIRRHLELPLHLQVRRNRLEFTAESEQIESVQPPLHPHQEEAGFVILVLVGKGCERQGGQQQPVRMKLISVPHLSCTSLGGERISEPHN